MSPPSPNEPSPGSAGAMRRDIDGLRAIAILLVVAYHAGVPWIAGGYVGVDVFFVLSGYLITSLLVAEVETTGALDLRRFYARRVRRLLPALVVMLIATVAAALVIYTPLQQRGFAAAAVATAAYMSNIRFAMTATDYLGPAATSDPFLHTWSLSVEEQFYLVWPILVMLAMGALTGPAAAPNRRRVIVLMAVATTVSFALSVWLTTVRQPWAFFLSPFRSWEFGAGGLAALLPPLAAVAPFSRMAFATGTRAASVLGWLGVGGILVAAALFSDKTPFPGTAAALPVLATIAVLRAGKGQAECGAARVLSRRPFQLLGRLSYSWYLWHWPVLIVTVAAVGPVSIPVRLGLMAAALVIAAGSYRWVENPIRHSQVLAARPGLSLAMGGVLTMLALGAAGGWRVVSAAAAESATQRRFTLVADDRPAYYAAGCHADFYTVEARGCTFGDEHASVTVVLFGDSHAAQWFPALSAIAEARGWRLVPLTKTGCPIVGGSRFNDSVGRKYIECSQWQRSAIRRLNELRPEIVVTSSFEGVFDDYTAGYRDYENDDSVLRETSRLFEGLGQSGAVIVRIKDNPFPRFDVPNCLALAAWRGGLLSASSCEFPAQPGEGRHFFDLQRRAMAGQSVEVIDLDLNDQICPRGSCLPEQNGIITYSDTHHLTSAFARSLAPILAERLDLALSHRFSGSGVFDGP